MNVAVEVLAAEIADERSHVFRNACSYELDWAKERLVADKLDAAMVRPKSEVASFIGTVREE